MIISGNLEQPFTDFVNFKRRSSDWHVLCVLMFTRRERYLFSFNEVMQSDSLVNQAAENGRAQYHPEWLGQY